MIKNMIANLVLIQTLGFWTLLFVNSTAVAEEVNRNAQGDKSKDTVSMLLVGEFISLPSSRFSMGNEHWAREEQPVHKVKINAFKLGKYEVTQAQWKMLMGNNPSHFKGANLPVEQVSWNDVQEYIRRLNVKTGRHFRLPTESEWEYAAIAGGTSPLYDLPANTFTRMASASANKDINDYGWYRYNSDAKTHPVGKKLPNAYGLYDMQGNVWEWVADCWHYGYEGAPEDGTAWTSGSCTFRVVRGGSWFLGEDSVHPTVRRWLKPELSHDNVGFRLAED